MIWHMGNTLFGCKKDLETQINQLDQKLKYHQIEYSIVDVVKYARKGRPKKCEIAQKSDSQKLDSQADNFQY